MDEKTLEAMGCPKDPIERIKWLRKKADKEKQQELKWVEHFNDLEDAIGTPKSGLKILAQQQVKKWKEDNVDIEERLLHFILELRLYLDVTRLRVAVLQKNTHNLNAVTEQLKESFGLDIHEKSI